MNKPMWLDNVQTGEAISLVPGFVLCKLSYNVYSTLQNTTTQNAVFKIWHEEKCEKD
jgi:hypothetical protein